MKINFQNSPYYRNNIIVYLDALAANFKYLSSRTKAKCAAVVKSDAYGVGTKLIVKELYKYGCRDFFVANLDEAIEIRAIIQKDINIFVLDGMCADQNYYKHYRLKPVLKSISELDLWLDICLSDKIYSDFGLHFDTGMNRFGIGFDEIEKIDFERIKKNNFKLIILSHLSCAFCKSEEKFVINELQLKRFERFRKIFNFGNFDFSLSSSAGFFLGSEYHFDMVRLGLALYGINPLERRLKEMDKLKTVLEFRAYLLQIKTVKKGEAIGYGACFKASKDIIVGIIGAGYADGIPYQASNRAIFRIGNHRAPVIGRVSMDMTVISLADVPKKYHKEGVFVEIFGKNAPIEKFADACQSHPHEILTRIGKRVLYLSK